MGLDYIRVLMAAAMPATVDATAKAILTQPHPFFSRSPLPPESSNCLENEKDQRTFRSIKSSPGTPKMAASMADKHPSTGKSGTFPQKRERRVFSDQRSAAQEL